MLAWEIARQWQEANCMTPFEEILGAHLSGGLVHSTPEVFLLAREVTWDPVAKEILQPSAFSLAGPAVASHPLRQPSPNAWFVELAAGACHNPVKEFLRVAPRSHQFVLWCRQSKGRKHDIHAYKWDHLARRVGHLG
jgi:hypothetical protein